MNSQEIILSELNPFDKRRLENLRSHVEDKIGKPQEILKERKGTPLEGLEVPRKLFPCLSLNCRYPLESNMVAPALYGDIGLLLRAERETAFFCRSCKTRTSNKPKFTKIYNNDHPNSRKMEKIKNYIRYHSKFIFANDLNFTSQMFFAYYLIEENTFLKQYNPAPLRREG